MTIHAGVNFVVAPFPGVDRPAYLRFQSALSDVGFNISNTSYNNDREFTLGRQSPSPMEIKVAMVGPQIGQLLILAQQPLRSLEMVSAEADDIAEAFNQTWSFPQRQILSCDATMRDLYETSAEHAFVELWEKRLHQTSDDLLVFGRGVLGGGLRFVMPPPPNDLSAPLIEVKIESFLADTSKLYLESQFTWRQPLAPGVPFDPSLRLIQVDNFIQKEVADFLKEGKS